MTMKRSAAASTLDPENPHSAVYMAARSEWNERYGSYIAQRDMWRTTAMAALTVAGIAVCGMVWTASQSRIVPYVVEVNKLGDALAVQRADLPPAINPNAERAQLARFIVDLRSVSTDAHAENFFIKEAYAMVDKNAAAGVYLNDFFSKNDPFKRAGDGTVSVTPESVLPLPGGNTWRVEWKEQERSRDGRLESEKYWEATITVKRTPVKTDAEIIANPNGLYIESISWAERLGSQ
jgi:type IV secretion system protein TrbF